VRVWKAVKIFIYGPLNFFIGHEAFSRNKFLQVWKEIWGCKIRKRGGGRENHTSNHTVSIANTLLWAGALSWWKMIFFYFTPGQFLWILTFSLFQGNQLTGSLWHPKTQWPWPFWQMWLALHSLALNHWLPPTASTTVWFLACSGPMSHPWWQNRPDSFWIGPNIAANIICAFAFDLQSVNVAPTLRRAFVSLILPSRSFTPFLSVCPWPQLSHTCLSSNMTLYTFSIVSSVVAVFGRSSHGSSSSNVRLCLNLAPHFLTVEIEGAEFL
jgi:hypothetical protein